MYPEFEKLKKAVENNSLPEVQKLVKKYGKSILDKEYERYGDQTIYPDYYKYYLIHLAIQNNSLPMIKYFKENGVSPTVKYTIESDFNSRADKYMDIEIFDIIQWAYKCNVSPELVGFLTIWKAQY